MRHHASLGAVPRLRLAIQAVQCRLLGRRPLSVYKIGDKYDHANNLRVPKFLSLNFGSAAQALLGLLHLQKWRHVHLR
jgi:hypothetical protein